MIKVYLSGASKVLNDNGASWRSDMQYWLEQYDLKKSLVRNPISFS